jgi:hypothetical protein
MATDYVRNLVCEEYEKAFYDEIKQSGNESALKNALKMLEEIYMEYGELTLFCWCAPKRCHAETIRSYLLDRCKPTAS